MLRFTLRRSLTGIGTIFAVATITFVLMNLAGGNVARSLLGESATQVQIDLKRHELGLDRPLLVRYVDWLGGAIRLDFGTSWSTHEPVMTAIASRLPVTLSEVILAILLTAIVAVVLGISAAVRRGWIDRLVQVFAVLGYALPNFWVALVLVTFFAVGLNLLPATGYVPMSDDPWMWLVSLILPVVSLAVATIASTAQQVRGATIDVLREDFVRTLRSHGLSERSVLFKHVLRSSAAPALTVLSLQFVGLLSGAVIIERVFALPGIGTLALNATGVGDLPLVLGIVVVMVFIVILVNLLIDLSIGWMNPKARLH